MKGNVASHFVFSHPSVDVSPSPHSPPQNPTAAPHPSQSVSWYALLNVVLAFLVPICTALWLMGRYMCCCCGPSRCSCLRCGTPWPTRKRPCCGYTDLPDGTLGYPWGERACTYALMVAFIAFASALVVSGTIYGNYGLSTGMGDLIKEGDGLVGLVQAALPPLTSFVMDLSDRALAPALVSINATLTGAVDLPQTVGALACVNRTLYSLPNVTAALAVSGGSVSIAPRALRFLPVEPRRSLRQVPPSRHLHPHPYPLICSSSWRCRLARRPSPPMRPS